MTRGISSKQKFKADCLSKVEYFRRKRPNVLVCCAILLRVLLLTEAENRDFVMNFDVQI